MQAVPAIMRLAIGFPNHLLRYRDLGQRRDSEMGEIKGLPYSQEAR